MFVYNILYLHNMYTIFVFNKLKLNIEKTKIVPFMKSRILKDIYIYIYIYIYIGNSKIEMVGN